MAKIDLVIFDFDGTLVDTAPDLVRSTNLFRKSLGLEEFSDAVVRAEIGMGLRSLIADLHPTESQNEKLLKELQDKFLKIYDQEYLTSPTVFPGLVEFLTEFDGIVSIVSNKMERYIPPILQKVGLDGFHWKSIIGGDTFANKKPHPEPFVAAMVAAGTGPESTLIVGDGYPDVEGALGIGARCVAVEFGYTHYEELMTLGAWKSIADFSQLLPLIRSIF